MIFFIFALGISGWSLAAFALAYILAIALSMSLHEFSHAIVAYKMGDPTPKAQKRLSLNPLNHIDTWGIISFLLIGFGWAKPVQVNPLNFRNYNRGRRLVALSGVTTNLILGIIFSAFYYFFGDGLIASSNIFFCFVGYFLMMGMTINISLAVFNLMPIYPLDGYNFLESFLKPFSKFVQFMRKYGSLILLIFIMTPVFDILYAYVVTGIENGLSLFWGYFK